VARVAEEAGQTDAENPASQPPGARGRRARLFRPISHRRHDVLLCGGLLGAVPQKPLADEQRRLKGGPHRLAENVSGE
jgi:hypothetical protein